jgi:hypothetical protein
MESAAGYLDHLAQVISHAMAPAFVLGAVSGFVAALMNRLNGIVDRIRTINAIPESDPARAHLKADLPRLIRRARLVNDAIKIAVASAVCTTILVIQAFVSALLGLRHEPLAVGLFVIAMALLGIALLTLAREVQIALNEYDHYG